MAAKTKEPKDLNAVMDDDFEEEGMVFVAPPQDEKPVKSIAEQEMEDSLTYAASKPKKKETGPMVEIFLPRLEDDGSIKVDQYEHVTIANENGEPERWRVLRGERVSVPVRVFMILHGKYGKDI